MDGNAQSTASYSCLIRLSTVVAVAFGAAASAADLSVSDLPSNCNTLPALPVASVTRDASRPPTAHASSSSYFFPPINNRAQLSVNHPTDERPHPENPPPANDTMGYEDSVYLAKLAEQAERYEGTPTHHHRTRHVTLTTHQKWSRT